MDRAHFLYQVLVPKVKSITGISDISLFRKRIKKRFGKLLYTKKYTATDLINIMCEMGMHEGSVVCIHSSMMEFYNYQGTAQEFIDAILKVIGSTGTLMMPAFPVTNPGDDIYIFDVENDKTGAGYLAETFRNYPGVKRSYNVRHSVCAIGKYADYLLSEHHIGHDCWDKHSPWYRLCELNGLVFNLGLPRTYIGTFHHCVESLLQYESPYWKLFFNKKRTYHYKIDGKVYEYQEYSSELLRKTGGKKVLRLFTQNEWQISRISNLEIKVFYSQNALNKMLELGRKGISVYRVPSTSKFKF